MSVTVEQVDRERAVAIMAYRWYSGQRTAVIAGEHDNWIPVQECAKHRIAEREACAGACEDFSVALTDRQSDDAHACATAIRARANP